MAANCSGYSTGQQSDGPLMQRDGLCRAEGILMLNWVEYVHAQYSLMMV